MTSKEKKGNKDAQNLSCNIVISSLLDKKA